MCFSVPMMFEMIPFDCSRIVLLADVSAKWINFDYLSLTSFGFCKLLIAACSQDICNYCSPHNRNSYFLPLIKMYTEYSQKQHWIFTANLIYIFKCMFVAYSQNVCRIFPAYLICCLESCSPYIR